MPRVLIDVTQSYEPIAAAVPLMITIRKVGAGSILFNDVDTDDDAAKEIAQKSLEDGMDPLDMINEGFTEGIRKMGDLFDRG